MLLMVIPSAPNATTSPATTSVFINSMHASIARITVARREAMACVAVGRSGEQDEETKASGRTDGRTEEGRDGGMGAKEAM